MYGNFNNFSGFSALLIVVLVYGTPLLPFTVGVGWCYLRRSYQLETNDLSPGPPTQLFPAPKVRLLY